MAGRVLNNMSRILVIDDDAGNRLIVKSRLSDLGYDVLPAETGAAGLIEAREQPLDLVMVSAGLGSGIDAVEVCRRLKAMPETHAIPVLLYSNLPAGQEELGRAYSAGCDSFVGKQELPVMDLMVRALLRAKALHDDLADQSRALEQQNRRLREERQQVADLETAVRESGQQALLVRELSAGRPDGVLLVDADGFLRRADRGASEFFGNRSEGKNLGRLAPASGLEAFVRDARTESREGFRFDLPPIGNRSGRSLTASVVPLVSNSGGEDEGWKVVLLLDAGRRRVAAEILRVQEPGIPRHQLGPLVEAARELFSPQNFVGDHEAVVQARQAALEYGDHHEPLLICGEAGVGKSQLGYTMHYQSQATGPLLHARCAALATESLERELIGYVKGAFDDAVVDRPGLLQMAGDGCVLLEELDAMSLELQGRLVELLETGKVSRIGSERRETVEARLIATLSRSAEEALAQGKLRQDLYELFTRRVFLPPLRERLEDVPRLALHFVARFGPCRGIGKVQDDVLSALCSYDWPGNVRELAEHLEGACRGAQGETLSLHCLPQVVKDMWDGTAQHELLPLPRGGVVDGTHAVGLKVEGRGSTVVPAAAPRRRPWDLGDDDPISLEHYEMKALLRALDHVEGDKLKAAKLLKVGKSTLYRKLKRFKIG
jgi:DNA-binding NtrC family response regulator